MKEIRDIIRFWEARKGQRFALATLVAAHGSSYRRPGARMLISATGEFAGGVSAGCIEDEVIACARRVLRSGMPQLLSFDTRLRFGCHGTIEIFVETLAAEVMREWRECIAGRKPCRLETVVHSNSRGTRLAGSDGFAGSFVQIIEPALRLILIGDSPDTEALRAQAALLDWEIRQYDAPPVPPGIIDQRSAVVVATHNFGRDCAALRDLLPAGLRYLGLIGSRRRRDELLFDVMHNGMVAESELYAPAGLHLRADSPEEIALSIVAEIQGVFAAGTARELRHHHAPIHQPANHFQSCAELPA
jgi:xanthine dehydrogenase accessory factor